MRGSVVTFLPQEEYTMLKQFLAFGVLTAVSGCTINITTEGSHEGFDHEWHEEKEEWHHEHDDHSASS